LSEAKIPVLIQQAAVYVQYNSAYKWCRLLLWDLQRNEKGESPLHRACIEGSLRKVKLLIDTVILVVDLFVSYSNCSVNGMF